MKQECVGMKVVCEKKRWLDRPWSIDPDAILIVANAMKRCAVTHLSHWVENDGLTCMNGVYTDERSHDQVRAEIQSELDKLQDEIVKVEPCDIPMRHNPNIEQGYVELDVQ